MSASSTSFQWMKNLRTLGIKSDIIISIFKGCKYILYVPCCGQGSSVGIVTDYGLDGPELNPGGDEIFCPSRLALGPTQPPVKWVPGLSWG